MCGGIEITWQYLLVSMRTASALSAWTRSRSSPSIREPCVWNLKLQIIILHCSVSIKDNPHSDARWKYNLKVSDPGILFLEKPLKLEGRLVRVEKDCFHINILGTKWKRMIGRDPLMRKGTKWSPHDPRGGNPRENLWQFRRWCGRKPTTCQSLLYID